MNQDFRKTRSYSDFLEYMQKHPDTPYVEMDTVKGVRERGKRMLTMLFMSDEDWEQIEAYALMRSHRRRGA